MSDDALVGSVPKGLRGIMQCMGHLTGLLRDFFDDTRRGIGDYYYIDDVEYH